MKPTLQQLIDETLDQIDNIDSLCHMFYDRRQFAIYKHISTALRTLLTGSSGQKGLVEGVLPHASFFPLRKSPDPATPDDFLVLPGPICIVRGEARVQLGNGTVTVRELDVNGGALNAMEVGEMFDQNGRALPLAQWLSQPFLRPDWTLKSFIAAVTNKDGGAHFEPNAVIRAMQKWGHFHWHVVAGIGRSIALQVRRQLTASFPDHVRPTR